MGNKPLSATLTIGLLLAVSLPVRAAGYPFPTVTRRVAERDLPCYMHNPGRPTSLNLARLCGNIPLPTAAPASSAPSTNSNMAVSGSGDGGVCNVPSDRDSSGRLCGGRAASERAGGR